MDSAPSGSWIWEQPQWPRFRWEHQQLHPGLTAANQARQHLLAKLEALDPSLQQEAAASLLSREGLNTTAIEGETLDPAMVRSSLARRLQLPLQSGQPQPSAQVEGLVDLLMAATTQLSAPLTVERLNGWHRQLFQGGASSLRSVPVGVLRSGSVPMQVVSGAIGRERVHFEAPPSCGLPGMLAVFLHWFNTPPQDLHPLLRSGVTHLWFVTLHPYEDGNGRLGRALTERVLAQASLAEVNTSPLVIHALGLSSQLLRQRQAYYQMLEAAQRGNLDITPWLGWFLEQVRAAAVANVAVVEAVKAKALFWWIHRTNDFNPRQRKLLNRLWDAEPEGFQGDLTIRKAVGLTRVSRATAYRDLSDLVKKGALVPCGRGRSGAYRLVLRQG
ncbi:MAG: Fic family protein [Synechococcus sp. SB0668_bin_15]|nr:Fic family protein [Synechococcus sp. SB0668_bin_15]MXZ83936.1 Fic family protein [Synechococcus sp. SB0666_bin_14]MYA90484.1 Fic family protein [Synechococcus sp. SB0663_bin_10]MYC50496.1 Fic family protein [Synechococcus sp. SB0662_bin_14]MYG47142.1 Fic family protein [Synechococcus sp. SB0675_bin_6]MYJ59856.1 Fic family protein [Synechococcus sp. SB0672_bin_6]MYK91651.1 Fic family protein [Synechococcus sp. SB0669_bin_8]